ncbi:hypothetical protein TCAL_03773 [Tigriopus californicus]|uniref:EF-hand domain-containing protein n=1 Tax=Tigriopus californicus TaxID=6832 RepID=A0A553NU34_TIGCA|nr:EF-hand calcium-binding domain-containing protein 4B-like [Tigriopus californicus]TRY68944.1 hypothetical protein TCAL_03773 [Tigriopus californicus]|eukprot:TCALIF_03773-PA protein Name:"Similar to efcab4a EF-hand calcium-binding domain-containing protein 4A (Danio rerio)" AED:0.02 eAED:0.02 QI:0/1/0.5/1/1/1/2/20/814
MSSPENLEHVPPEAMAELRELLTQKAADLFSLCDQEDKGFVTKRDMQRMRGELPMEPEQLEAVFDTLDVDKNGYLTLEEFREGFDEFLGLEQHQFVKEEHGCSLGSREHGSPPLFKMERDDEDDENEVDPLPKDDEEEFNDVLSELGLLGLIEDDTSLRSMWLNLKRDNDPVLMTNFEDFLSKLSADLGRKTSDKANLENNLRSRQLLQEEHIQGLYEEMEQQIGKERKKIQEEEERKEQKMREELEATLHMKDQQLMDVMHKMEHYQSQLEQVKKAVPDMKVENVHLSKERDRLQSDLERERILMKDLHDQMEELRSQTQTERKARAKAAFKVSENIAQEREGLVQQLDLMKTLNNKMLDDQDQYVLAERTMNKTQPNDNLKDELDFFPDAKDHYYGYQDNKEAPDFHFPKVLSTSGSVNDIEYDEEYFEKSSGHGTQSDYESPTHKGPIPLRRPRFGRFHSATDAPGDNISLMDELAQITDGNVHQRSPALTTFREHGDHSPPRPCPSQSSLKSAQRSLRTHSVPDCRYKSSLGAFNANHPGEMSSYMESTTSGPGPESYGDSELTSLNTRSSDFVGHHHHHHHHPHPHSDRYRQYVVPLSQMSKLTTSEGYEVMRNPERVYKVIFIGDSSVGKSSLITRFCSGKFQPGLKSTIGVDFHTRSILVEDQSVCLQCWDTAGQERYRAITRQYFRKTDAVIVVYDITSEKSFLNAREWLDSAVEGADEAILLLVGNKLDLAQDDLLRRVRKTQGLKLAEQYASQFGEVSAANGSNVEDTLTDLAKALLQREDQNMQNALNLILHEEPKKKRGCCK